MSIYDCLNSIIIQDLCNKIPACKIGSLYNARDTLQQNINKYILGNTIMLGISISMPTSHITYSHTYTILEKFHKTSHFEQCLDYSLIMPHHCNV